jgi:hypothetical protein
VSNPKAVHIKARSVVRQLGYSESDTGREYRDWHIEVRSGLSFVSVWTSAGMVFLSLANIPVYYRPGPWEQYLDLLFRRAESNGRAGERGQSRRSLAPLRLPPEPSEDN